MSASNHQKQPTPSSSPSSTSPSRLKGHNSGYRKPCHPISPTSQPQPEQFQEIHDYLRRRSEATERSSSQFRVSKNQWLPLRNDIFSSDVRAWAEDKLHYTYNPVLELLSFPMPGPFHEKLIERLRNLIEKKLAALGEMHDTHDDKRPSMVSIESAGSPQLDLSDTCSRSPDISFSSGKWPPTFVGEVGVSQPGDVQFAKIAEQYIYLSHGKIRTLLGVDIEYRLPKDRHGVRPPYRTASYQIFRYSKQNKTISVASEGSIKFHDADGVISPNATLRLHLSDFFTSNAPALNNYHIDITHQELADILMAAEDMQAKADHPDESSQSSVDYDWQHYEQPPPDDDGDDKDNVDNDIDVDDDDDYSPSQEVVQGPATTRASKRRKTQG